MTLPYSLRRAGPFAGTGVLAAFPFTFKVFAKTDVSAQLTVNGVTTTLVQDSDYIITLNTDQESTPGGDIQYTLAVGATLTLLGSLPYDQPTDLPAGGAYRAQVVENALDRIVIQTQQLAESADRSLRAPVGEVLAALPNRAARANTVQGYDSNGDPSVAAPASGTAADVLIKLANTANVAEGASLVGNAAVSCSARSFMKGLSTALTKTVHLTEAGRAGIFIWTAGDFSTHVAADTQEGVYVKANAVAAGLGAWVRATTDGQLWETDWFGVPNAASDGTGTACQAQYSAMMATANLVSPAGVRFGSGVYSMDSAPTGPTFICEIAGTKSSVQPTILIKRYFGSGAGMLAGGAHALRVRDLSVQAIGAGVGAGSLAISMILPAITNIGEPLLENVRTSMGTSNSNEILIDGSAATGAPVGYRTGTMRGLQCFGNLVMRSCQHWFMPECFIAGDLVITGTAAAPSDDIHAVGIVGRHLDLGAGVDATGFISRVTFHGVVQTNILNRVNCSRVLLVSDFGGIAERNWDVNTCRTYSQSVVQDWGSNANGVFVKFGNGDIEQWGNKITTAGAATVTFPTPFTSTVTYAGANSKTAPAANQIELVQAHTVTLAGMTLRSMTLTTTPIAALSGVDAYWYAKGV